MAATVNPRRTSPFLLLTLLLTLFFSFPIFAEDKVDVHTGYNIVFVVDNSDSLKRTDPARLRVSGMSKMLSWLPGTGSRAGLVVFSTKAETYGSELCLVEGKEDVMRFSSQLPVNPADYTNITAGLSSALSYLDEGRGADPKFNNLIVLFSDGNIDLPKKSSIESARREMLRLAEEAKAQGTEIATVVLNNNGNANVSDMQSIASSGLFIEATDAQSLEDAFKALYDSKFKADTTLLNEGTNHFWVTIGASALNFNFEPQKADDDFILTSPLNQKSYTKDSPEVYQVGGVYVLNILRPTYGQWKCELTGGVGRTSNPLPEGFWAKFAADMIQPWPSGIALYGIQTLFTILQKKSSRVVAGIVSFILASGLYALVFFGGALFPSS